MTRNWAIDDERLGQAADWLARLQADDLAEADVLAFDAWLAASPQNAAAYDAVLSVSREVEANAAAVRRELRQKPRPRPAPWAGYGLAAAAAVAAVAVVFGPDLAPAPKPLAYATGIGERRSLTLADGSRLDLDGGTRLTVSLRRRERDVRLDQGEAVFDVAHDPRRPFLIAAGDRTVRVVGTEFDVRRRAGELAVTVARGIVEVTPSGGGSGEGFRLTAGQRLEHREGAPVARVVAAAPDQALGWRTGKLVYRDAPLAQVVADLDARFTTPIRVTDPGLAATPISGVLILDHEDAVVRRLALLVSAKPVPSDGGVTLQRIETPGR